MILCVDIGNSRVKWAPLTDGTLGPQHAARHAGWTTDDWRAALFGAGSVGRVVASTVAGGSSAAALDEAAKLETGHPARFVASTPEAAGVVNGYADPTLLGVDRWLAVIAGYHLARGPCVVADIGTAATVDAVDAGGRHLGGFIVPGPALMVASLHAGTSDLAARSASSEPTPGAPFADNTRDAIERGCRMALAALVERSVDDAARTGPRPRLFLTGGAVAEVLPSLRATGEIVPDLVLRGIVRWLESGRV